MTLTPIDDVSVRDTYVEKSDNNTFRVCIEVTYMSLSNGVSNNTISTAKEQILTEELEKSLFQAQ